MQSRQQIGLILIIDNIITSCTISINAQTYKKNICILVVYKNIRTENVVVESWSQQTLVPMSLGTIAQ